MVIAQLLIQEAGQGGEIFIPKQGNHGEISQRQGCCQSKGTFHGAFQVLPFHQPQAVEAANAKRPAQIFVIGHVMEKWHG